MNVEFGAEAPLFPEKEYISGIIFFAVYISSTEYCVLLYLQLYHLMFYIISMYVSP